MTIDELRANIGVSPSVAQKMLDVQANVILNDGTLLRTCEHGVRHAVGSLDGSSRKYHEISVGVLYRSSGCCEGVCCATWRTT